METYHGYVRTPADAIKLFEACRQGLLPRVQRRLSEKERQSIRSGSVFVWDEREAGMRRWTDGKSWSASRVSGSFLTYREMEGKRGGGFGNTRRGGGAGGKTPDSGRGSDEDQDDGEPDGYRYKADGLMKQSFSITTSNGQHLHLISYYSRPQHGQAELPQPSTDSTLRGVLPVKGMYPESSLNETSGPALTRTPMQQQPYGPPPPHYQQQPPHGPPGGYPQYMHQQGYPSWPPSPMATPPYGQHYTVAPPPGAPYPPSAPHPHQAAGPPPGNPYTSQPYASAPPHSAPNYDRAPLPLPNPVSAAPASRQVAPTTLAPYNHPSQPSGSPHTSYARIKAESPHPPQLNLPDAKPPIGLRAGNGYRQGGPLPAISTAMRTTPPPRQHSASPPRSSHSDSNPANVSAGGNKASLSALLHPTPTSSEPGSANPGTNSAGSSPRHPPGSAGGQPLMASGLGPTQSQSVGREDQRALGALDRKFCI